MKKYLYFIVLLISFIFIPDVNARSYESDRLNLENEYNLKIGNYSTVKVSFIKNEKDNTFGVKLSPNFNTNSSLAYYVQVDYYDTNNNVLFTDLESIYYNKSKEYDSITKNYKSINLNIDDVAYYKVKISYNELKVEDEKYAEYDYLINNYSTTISIEEDKIVNVNYSINVSFKDKPDNFVFYLLKHTNPSDKSYEILPDKIKSDNKHYIDEEDDYYKITFILDNKDNNISFNYNYKVEGNGIYINILNDYNEVPVLNYYTSIKSSKYHFNSKLLLSESNAEKISKSNEAYQLNSNYNLDEKSNIYLSINIKDSIIFNKTTKYEEFTFSKPFNFRYITLTIITFLFSLGFYFYAKRSNNIKVDKDKAILKKYNSAEIGYLYDRKVHTREVLSLLIHLANLGYIQIADFIDDFEIRKLKDYDGVVESERIFMEKLFTKKGFDRNHINGHSLKKVDKILASELAFNFDINAVKKGLEDSVDSNNLYKDINYGGKFLCHILIIISCVLIVCFSLGYYYQLSKHILSIIVLSLLMYCIIRLFLPMYIKHFKKMTEFSLSKITLLLVMFIAIFGTYLLFFSDVLNDKLIVIVDLIQIVILSLSAAIVSLISVYGDIAKNIDVEINNLASNLGSIKSKAIYKYLPLFYSINSLDLYFDNVDTNKFNKPDWFYTIEELTPDVVKDKLLYLFTYLKNLEGKE